MKYHKNKKTSFALQFHFTTDVRLECAAAALIVGILIKEKEGEKKTPFGFVIATFSVDQYMFLKYKLIDRL